MSYSSAHTITTVARREIQVALRNKGIIISVIITLLLAIGGIGVISWLTGREGDDPALAVVGMEAGAFTDTGIEASAVDDRAQAEAAVLDGDADAALVPAGHGWDLLTEGSPSAQILGAVDQITSARASAAALEAVGVDAGEFAAATPPSAVTAVDIGDGGDGTSLGAVVTVLAGVMILMFTVMLFAANIGGRVTEEKSSRVVEIILASVRPMDFLTGKILGNALFGLAATALIVTVAAVALNISGLLDGVDFQWGIIGILLVGFMLGLVFYGSLYAAAGAMVQRTEDLQSTQTPILILILATTYVPLFGWQVLDATWMQVLAWVPPVSVAVAPLQYAGGNLSLAGLAASYTILAVATVGVIWLVARIYRNAILNNGRKLTWRQALTRK
ncbi:ABC transporter permease [Corynebacterium halotolerans]|uniref:ABC transporter permease n=1 Tax=Corynebacterium halotolerans YIM 70093 = DSM 44683 TaxID=1121362 RepID=M1P569_9CORY|nr:ABC transporter permease [Corynebacterium halotolerans]AGF71816.1 ABC transporter permease [Corynebacterium halotolerans YIM 70093 = DSM 44683]